MGQRIVFVALVAVLLSSCQKKAEGQTVAVVNNEEITASELNDELARQNLSGSAATPEGRNRALQQLISRRLLAQQAKSDGLDQSPEFLKQQRRMTEDLLINMLVSRQVNTAQVPSAEEIKRFEASRPEIFTNREIWTLDQVVYPLPKDKAVSAKLVASKSLNDVIQALNAANIQFTRSQKQIDSAVFPHEIYQQIVNLKPGEPFIAPGPDKAAASVIIAKQPNPLPDDKARQLALAGLRREQIDKFVDQRVKSLKSSAKIQYQPGFGPPKG
jgi:EpsD family peptidyl-prolyl cis-trans isomerase